MLLPPATRVRESSPGPPPSAETVRSRSSEGRWRPSPGGVSPASAPAGAAGAAWAAASASGSANMSSKAARASSPVEFSSLAAGRRILGEQFCRFPRVVHLDLAGAQLGERDRGRTAQVTLHPRLRSDDQLPNPLGYGVDLQELAGIVNFHWLPLPVALTGEPGILAGARTPGGVIRAIRGRPAAIPAPTSRGPRRCGTRGRRPGR